ncbi:hypothetical protein ACHAXR_000605 [Thalassiosira sp. AJA248-18]
MSTPQDASLRTDGSGTFSVATWNIRSGRNGGLEPACRAMSSLGVDIAFLQEAKLTRGIHTRFSSGYSIVATDAPSAHQGGVALLWRDNELFEIEETKIRHPNVISFELMTGVDRYFVVGAYLPPTDLDTLEHVRKAWQTCPKGCKMQANAYW